MGKHCKILQVIGFENSGKTTLMEHLISQATSEGLRVGAIKHHGHGGIPVENSKDSARHEEAGACVTAVEGEGILRMSIHQSSWELDDILAIYENLKLDVILVEGYKYANYSKVVLLRTLEDRKLLNIVSNILCVIYWPTCPLETQVPYPTFSLFDQENYIEFLMKELRG